MFLLKPGGLHWLISKIHLLSVSRKKSKGPLTASFTIAHSSSPPLNLRGKVRDLGHLQKEENDGEGAFSKQEFRNRQKKLYLYICDLGITNTKSA